MPELKPFTPKHGMRLSAALAALALLLTAGCDTGPDLGHDREQVRVLHEHQTNAQARPHAARLSDDDFRVVRLTIAKPQVTPTDAARLPLGGVKILKKSLTDPRFRRYGPTIVRLIGMLGDESEYLFLRDYLENEIKGSVDEYTFRTLLAIPEALGYIAIHNDHAYTRLRDYLRLQFWRENIQWRFMASDREANAYRLVLAALDGIAISGRRAAVPYIQFMVEHQSRDTATGAERTQTLMDERLEARARETINILRTAQ